MSFDLLIFALFVFPVFVLFVGILRHLLGFAETATEVLWAPIVLFIMIMISLLSLNLARHFKRKKWNKLEPNKPKAGNGVEAPGKFDTP